MPGRPAGLPMPTALPPEMLTGSNWVTQMYCVGQAAIDVIDDAHPIVALLDGGDEWGGRRLGRLDLRGWSRQS